MHVRALRHVAFEDLGLLEALLEARGARVEVVDVPTADLTALDPLVPDLLVVLGGPIGANDEALFPFLEPELQSIARRLAARRPTLGICLGAQLMARALGARVHPARRKEIGWAGVQLTEAGRAGPLGRLGDDAPMVLHWHGDNFDLPDGAERLASTEVCPNQAFRVGEHALGLQFHLEVTPMALERWLVGHVVEIGAARGVFIDRLRADTRRFGPALEAAAPGVFAEWLDGAGLASRAA
jgi:GMP synthase (glutamine-hydrolysing)